MPQRAGNPPAPWALKIITCPRLDWLLKLCLESLGNVSISEVLSTCFSANLVW